MAPTTACHWLRGGRYRTVLRILVLMALDLEHATAAYGTARGARRFIRVGRSWPPSAPVPIFVGREFSAGTTQGIVARRDARDADDSMFWARASSGAFLHSPKCEGHRGTPARRDIRLTAAQLVGILQAGYAENSRHRGAFSHCNKRGFSKTGTASQGPRFF